MLEFYIKLYHITIVTDLANDIDEINPPPLPTTKFWMNSVFMTLIDCQPNDEKQFKVAV